MSRAGDFPVVVIGGGPAGSIAARDLARQGIPTLLLERSDGRGNPVGETLAPSANPLFHRLELCETLTASGAMPSYGNRFVWGEGGASRERDFLRDPDGHGWHLDRSAFNAVLLDHAAEAGASVWRNARALSWTRREERWRLEIAVGAARRAVGATILVDATGRAALVARRAGVRRRVLDRQVAAIATLASGGDGPGMADTTTLVEAAEAGWWYSALLPNGRLIVAWCSDPDLLVQSGAGRVAGWWRQLLASPATAARVAQHQLSPPQRVTVVAAGSSVLPLPGGPGWLAVGDAAAAYDPLASHGIGGALAGGRAAATAVAALLAGDEAALPRYTDRLLADFARFCWLRHAYYGEERRWPAAPYWRRRQPASGLLHHQ